MALLRLGRPTPTHPLLALDRRTVVVGPGVVGVSQDVAGRPSTTMTGTGIMIRAIVHGGHEAVHPRLFAERGRSAETNETLRGGTVRTVGLSQGHTTLT
jgi:hypothetical protein